MKAETILEVVGQLIGYCEPYGDEAIDETRYSNQEKIILLVQNGIDDLINNAKYKDRAEHSMSHIGKRAYEALELLDRMISSNI